MPAADLTICSVSYGDVPLIGLNRALCERMNPGVAARWRVVRNLPVQAADAVGVPDADVEFVDGEALDHAAGAARKSRSHHHALGLNRGTCDVETRYIAVIDADCFIVRPHWIRDVLAHMRAHELAFFGVPYHPRGIAKVRYFPCAVFVVIDTTQVPESALDWTPQAAPERPAQSLVDRWLRRGLIDGDMTWRLRGELSEDTGIRVYRRFRAEGLASECAVPVYTAADVPHKLRSPRQLVLERLLPDRYCVVPKRLGAFTDRGFADAGLEGFTEHGCEEYMWRGDPFALHLRGGPAELRADLGRLRERLWRMPAP